MLPASCLTAPLVTLYTVCCRKVVGRSQCPLCGRSRKFYCYSCYCLIGLDASDVPRIRLPIKIDMYVDIQYQYIIIYRIWVVSQASPFTRGGRVWSNSHHKFVLQSQQWANSIRCDQYFDADCGKLWRFSVLFWLSNLSHTIQHNTVCSNAVSMRAQYEVARMSMCIIVV